MMITFDNNWIYKRIKRATLKYSLKTLFNANYHIKFNIIMMEPQQQHKIYGHIDDICLLGHGSIGRGALPLIKRHFTFERLTIVDPFPVIEPKEEGKIKFRKEGLNRLNFKEILDSVFEGSGKIKFCVNLSVEVETQSLIIYCQERKILYIDTAVYPWGDEPLWKLPCWRLCNHAFRRDLLRGINKFNHQTTAVVSCGANPGMVSWFVKQALVNLAKDTQYPLQKQPQSQREWALLMQGLGVKGIHIAQRDTQISKEVRPAKQFWNTWSVEAYMHEGSYAVAQMSWGTHEKEMQRNSFVNPYEPIDPNVVYFDQPGMNVTVKSWCPTYGPQLGFMITHYEVFSITQFFTVKQGDKVIYRPTCNYAYHPAPDAMASTLELIGSGEMPEKKDWKVLEQQIVTGMDELGVLLYGHSKNAYWYGSQLTIEDTRKRVPDQNATALQVTSAVIAGMAWALNNPERGYVEADNMDYKFCLNIQEEYISPVKGYYTDWTPLKNHKNELTDKNLDLEDPWQFKNILIHK